MRLCYCESPLQLAESIEYNQYKPVTNVFFIVRDNGSAIQRVQFERLLKGRGDRFFISIPGDGIVKKLIATLVLFFFILARVRKIESFVVGDARSLYVRIIYLFSKILGKDIVLVDDGLYLMNFWRSIKNKNYIVFTGLPLKEICASSRLDIIEKSFDKITPCKKEASVFIGMKLVEIGYVSWEMYFNALKIVINEADGNELIYYAHREEDEEKLSSVEALGFKVMRPDFPLEVYLKDSGAHFGVYYTFYSTALYNVSRILLNAEFVSFIPRSDVWPIESRAAIDECYELFKGAGNVTIVPMES